MMAGKAKAAAVLLLILLISGLLVGCGADQFSAQPSAPTDNNGLNAQTPQTNAGTPNNSASPPGTMRLTVYNATADAMYLVPEVRVVPHNDHPAQTAIELLLQGTGNQNLVSVMPAGTKLRNLWIHDHVAYVDFNNQLVRGNTGGSAMEILQVAAIVDTLTEFPEITRVQILINGKRSGTIAGHVDISEPLSRSDKIIKKTL